MFKFILAKLGLALLVALTVSFISFILLYLAGDPAVSIAGENATAEVITAVRQQYGFDRPLITQYLDWLMRALSGDFGMSYYFRVPVADMIAERLPVTMAIGGLGMLFALIVAIPMGVLAAAFPNTWIDRAAIGIAVVGQAIPSFWFGLILIVVFSVNLGMLPASGTRTWTGYILPMVVLGYYAMPAIMRLTRAGMMEVLAADYIRTARAKGLNWRIVMFKHALRNAIIPVVSLAAVQLGFMFGGSVIVETVFALHGAGFLAWESISRNDLPTMQALILIFSMFYIGLTFLADILNAWLDPRLRSN
ncbi:peptide/nickel transport system permease protein [Rhizobium mongolense subsp. loessense]|uniref:Peptide/nickel transport system permease protein n=1 Tax=Rhizobium mongolense subsp. loessense TaxID=158890 RepID=A0A1G4S9L8_9HYPH|nr:ABC transporter permease [Rhizobium mongolense]SCW65790.1 peptide/nickel transport system permease protein [Rhizobium mongolense subsp. loessense]